MRGKWTCYTVVLLFLVFLVLVFAYSQEDHKIIRSVGVTASSPPSGFTEVQQQVLDHCNKELQKRNIPKTDDPDWLILTNALKVNDDLVVISVSSLCAMPRELIEHCAKDEYVNTFFLQDKKDLPKDGKFVREWPSSQFMSQFYQIRGTRMYAVKPSDIESTCAEIVDSFRDY